MSPVEQADKERNQIKREPANTRSKEAAENPTRQWRLIPGDNGLSVHGI
jgi:hypothetical protein